MKNNIIGNKNTINVIQMYENYLYQLNLRLKDKLNDSKKVLAVSENTYKTANVSFNVTDLIEQSQMDFSATFNIKPPEVISINDLMSPQVFNITHDLIKNN